MNSEKKHQLTGGGIFASVGVLAVLASVGALAGPWWTLLICGVIFTVMGFYTIGKVID